MLSALWEKKDMHAGVLAFSAKFFFMGRIRDRALMTVRMSRTRSGCE